MANSEEKKRQIMDHVKRTRQTDPSQQSSSSAGRKRQIMDHVKRSRG
ncbi:MAG: hypothetical protein SAK42_22395 [Oscillatoria sp. PMC 1076.18]|nr:hypothetical protein [Oscillatoria sp. PMC 1076.18]